MPEADERFLERLRPEVDSVVRGWGRVTGLRLDRRADRIRIVVALNTPAGPTEVECDGETLVDAAAVVPARVGQARLELAFRRVVLSADA